jgi:predicted RNA-binding Zn-ribbon protein involved in translation (DUF1610 family)
MSDSRLSRSSKEFKARVASVFGVYRVASRIASDSDDRVSYIKKTPGKGYCVKSKSSPDWSGGCYPTKGEAEKRLDQVEMFKHMKKKKKGKKKKTSSNYPPGALTIEEETVEHRCPNGHTWEVPMISELGGKFYHSEHEETGPICPICGEMDVETSEVVA